MTGMLGTIAEAIERVALAMDAETDALRTGRREQFSAAGERKRATIEAAEALMRSRSGPFEASTHERARLERAAQRLQAASGRNAETLQGALQAMRRLFACVAEAAQTACMTGTYGPDGRLRVTEETVRTLQRSA